MAQITSSLLAILLFSLLSVADELKQNGEECDCFITNDTSSGYFSYHRFHDFRNIIPSNSNFTGIPTVIEDYDSDDNFVPSSSFFGNSTGWNGDWEIQTWNNSENLTPENAADGGPAVLMRNSASNVYIEPSNDSNSNYSTYLTLRTTRLKDFQSVGEIDSTRGNFLHLSARFLARITGSPGACAGLFTYLDNTNPQKVQEIDMEILTSGPNSSIQYTNQPSHNKNGDAITGAYQNVTLPNGQDWGAWNVYRMDWMPEATTFYVNGDQVARNTPNVPRKPSQLMLNMWGDGGEWTGGMEVGESAYLQIQWIEVVFNTSGPYMNGEQEQKKSKSKRSVDEGVVERDGHGAGGNLLRKRGHKGCKVVCSIDDVADVGTPVLLYNNSSPAPRTFIITPGFGNLAVLSWIGVIVAGAFGVSIL